MNEVASVYDASVGEPPQLEIDCDIFQAWTQGIKVPELVATLKSALLAQYDLDSSAAGSGYANLAAAEVSESSSSSSSSDDDPTINADDVNSTPRRIMRRHTTEPEEDVTIAGVGVGSAVMNTPKPKQRGEEESKEDSIGAAVAQQLRRADAANLSSSEDEEHERRLRKAHGSRRNSATASVSGKVRSGHTIRSTPQLPATSPVALSASNRPRSRGSRKRSIPQPPLPPQPSSIDLLSSNQAQARLLWSWETQLEHQYRLYALLEHSLRKPFLLSLHYCILQLSFQIQLQLTNLYYEFDTIFMRYLMGQKLSPTTKGGIDSILERVKEDRISFLAAQEKLQRGRAMSSDVSEPPTPHTQQLQQRPNQQGLFPTPDASSTAMNAALSSSTESTIRSSSACRQFDNLRRIYRCRWGEKGDGGGRLDELEVSGSSLLSGSSSKERWRNMRAAAVAAMAKRGFGVEGGAGKSATSPVDATSPSSTQPPNASSQQQQRRVGDSNTSLLTQGSGLADFFGFDSSSQSIRMHEQTAPIFLQAQFRLTSSLARRYSRLVFLSHYRIDLSPSTRRGKKHASEVLSFAECELIAQILMRCWCVPVGAGADALAVQAAREAHAQREQLSVPSQGRGASLSPMSSLLSGSTTAATNPALTLGASSATMPGLKVSPHGAGDLTTTGSLSIMSGGTTTEHGSGRAATHVLNPSMFVAPGVSRMITASESSIPSMAGAPGPRRQSVDDTIGGVTSPTVEAHTLRTLSGVSTFSPVAPSTPTGAASRGFDFLPIVAQMQEQDEDVWVGDVLDVEFLEGLRDLKTFMSSRVLDEYVAAMVKCFRDTTALQLAQLQQPLLHTHTQSTIPSLHPQGSLPFLAHAATVPVIHHGSSASVTSPVSPDSTTQSNLASSPLIRSSVLVKLQGKLLPWLKSLLSMSIALPKNKKIRTLVTELQEEILKPLVKLGCNASEVVYLLRIVRETVVTLPSIMRFDIEREAKYPYPYERRERAAAAAAATAKDEISKSQQSDATRPLNSTPSLSAMAPGGSGSLTPATGPTEPMHRAFIHWCRFLDAVGPISVILFLKLNKD